MRNLAAAHFCRRRHVAGPLTGAAPRRSTERDRNARAEPDRRSVPRTGDLERVRQVGRQALHRRAASSGAHLRRDVSPPSGFQTLDVNSGAGTRSELPPIAGAARMPEAGRPGAARHARPHPAPRRPDPAADPARADAANLPLIELVEQKILRAVYSERQLQEVLTDFWFNHFNVDARKGRRPLPADRVRARRHPAARARQVPRSARGHREEPGDALLSRQLDERGSERSARARCGRRESCAGRSAGRRLDAAQPPRMPPQGKNAPKGLNENYGRELMELHTLGVDGGYTQKDVTEVARAFTGWTIRQPAAGRRLPLRAAAARRRARRSCSAT